MLHKIDSLFTIESLGNIFDHHFPPDFDYKGERHDYMEFVYVVSGCVQVTENGRVYNLSEHDLILHGPMEFHRIKSRNGTAPHVFNISMCIRGQLPPSLLDGVFHLSESQRERFMDCIHRVQAFQPGDNDPGSRQQVGYLFGSLLLELGKEDPVSGVLAQESSALVYKRLVKAMQNAVYQNLCVEDLAAANFISVSYLKKLFRKYANESPKHFYDGLRAKEAALLLQEGQGVTAVAEKLSFSSPNYFTLFFRKHFGVTPSRYRKMNET